MGTPNPAGTYPALELLICDDKPTEAITEVVERRTATAPFPIRYHRNPESYGELGSTARGIALDQGEYVKLLHDDDVRRRTAWPR